MASSLMRIFRRLISLPSNRRLNRNLFNQFLLIAVASASLPALLAQESVAPDNPGASAVAQPETFPAYELPDPVAKVYDREIPAQELRLLVQSRFPNPETLKRVPADQQKNIYSQGLNALIADRLVSRASRVIKIDKADIDVEVGKLAQQAGSSDELQAQLAQEGRTLADLRNAIEDSMRQKQWLQPQIAKSSEVSEEEVAAFYKERPEASQAPEVARASHILVLTPPESGAEGEAEALKKIQDIRRQIVEGEPFEIMAKKHSEDPGSKDKGGDLNYFRRGQMVKEFEDVAFTLPVNDVSGPVKTQFGYHLIKITDRQEARTIPLEEATPRIVAFLQDQKRREAVEAIVEKLRSEADIEIFLP